MKPNAGRFLTEQFSASTPRKSSISWMHESYYLNAAHATGSTNLLTSAGCSVCCVPTWHFSDKGKMQKPPSIVPSTWSRTQTGYQRPQAAATTLQQPAAEAVTASWKINK
ncbi:cardiac phospholamban isoform X4 [Tympanuchus pallidicinctus]|uniref:cardiac phospholamban isoform X4 n=1 Tax=Tympanuchus pallidicinctus TaxID=109042 RepID=UPI0022875E49|nr:cardiac phospholamban isoform X4 [Tympanuchus pallidicinctus]